MKYRRKPQAPLMVEGRHLAPVAEASLRRRIQLGPSPIQASCSRICSLEPIREVTRRGRPTTLSRYGEPVLLNGVSAPLSARRSRHLAVRPGRRRDFERVPTRAPVSAFQVLTGSKGLYELWIRPLSLVGLPAAVKRGVGCSTAYQLDRRSR